MSAAMFIQGRPIFEDASQSSGSWQSSTSSSVPRHHYRSTLRPKDQASTFSGSAVNWDGLDAWINPLDAASRSSSISSTASKSRPLQRLLTEERHAQETTNTPRPSSHEVYHRRTRSNSVSMNRPRTESFSGNASWQAQLHAGTIRPIAGRRTMSVCVSNAPWHDSQSYGRDDTLSEWAIGDSD